MRYLTSVVLALSLVGVAAADSYLNDFSSLAGLENVAPAGAPYLIDSDTAVRCDVSDTGYALLRIYPASYQSGTTLDLTSNRFDVTVRYDGPATGTVGFWLRVYAGTWNGTQWTVKARAAYSISVPANAGWTTVSKNVIPPDEVTYYDGTTSFDPATAYYFRLDAVEWASANTPYSFAIDTLRFYPIPPVIHPVNSMDTARATVEYTRQLTLDQGANVTWSLGQHPAGMAIDPTGRISGWTPSTGDLGKSFTVEVTATNTSGSDTKTWEAFVNPAATSIQFAVESTPEPSEFGTSLASDGTRLYYFKKDTGQLFCPDPGTSGSWFVLASAPGGGDGADCGSLAFYAGLGAQGALITRRDLGGGERVLCTYDIATNIWIAHGNRNFGNTGYVVIGDTLYGNAHAAMVNQGGPTTIADLKDLDAITCQRAAFVTGTGGILGEAADWFSRAVQMTTVNGMLYGIKNDWTSPAGTGDRLWVIKPSAIVPNQYIGPNWDDWTHNASTAIDLGPLPFEPGYSSAIVPLPAGWSAEIGGLGGLLIIAGRSPSNHEGWGEPSSQYALYDIAGGTFTVKNLPGTTGSGTSATFHQGKVYIKRGSSPSADNDPNTDLWVMSVSLADPCAMASTLAVNSAPTEGISVYMSADDCDGNNTGTTPFTRSVGYQEYVSILAPILKGYTFLGWSVDGAEPATTDQLLSLQVTAPVTATATYQLRCDTPVVFNVSAEGPGDPVAVAYTPKDCSGGETATTPFTVSFGSGETVTLAAPYVPHMTFVRWDVEGETPIENSSATLAANGPKTLRAVYGPETPAYRTGCWQFVQMSTPVEGSYGTSLASDGYYLYYMTANGQLYRSPDGHGWLPLADAPSDPDGDPDGALAFYPGLGDQGTLVTNRDVGLCTYDIATDTWSVRVNRYFGHTGFTVIGDYLYGNSHAAAVNQGGPTTVADLKDLDAPSCFRAAFTGLEGRDPGWFSRVVQMTAVNDILYGIKNDWQTSPASDGDRLWSIDPKDLRLNTKTGPEWYEWTHEESPAIDLGQLPFEPGYGSAMAPLPAKWSCGVGNDGGLLIVAGRANGNQEGFGPDPSPSFTIYDIASKQFTTGVLPAATGSGTSATTHKGRVYIKRGGEPASPYNTTLWVMSLQGTSFDLNFDGHVNRDDLELYFAPCFSGPTIPFGTILVNDELFDCRAGDYDQDGDVDQADFGSFQRCLSRNPLQPISPDCQ
ncbi:MAG TPA: hypothetical protein PKY77_13780 [Phycisphaerae bacterium]|nr:hypothetical protein [Phycisphaerae bacterium]HRY70493.1 hypothetical protein [Phycisphaerae bacterium]HSA28222.1 hypothetical protein [Phycisphaerae bacterium]